MNIEKLEAMLAKGQDSSLLRMGLAQAYLDADLVADAISHLLKCLELDADYTAAWKLLGKARLAAGDIQGARQDWQRGLAVSQRRGDRQAEKEIGVFLRRLDKQFPSE